MIQAQLAPVANLRSYVATANPNQSWSGVKAISGPTATGDYSQMSTSLIVNR